MQPRKHAGDVIVHRKFGTSVETIHFRTFYAKLYQFSPYLKNYLKAYTLSWVSTIILQNFIYFFFLHLFSSDEQIFLFKIKASPDIFFFFFRRFLLASLVSETSRYHKNFKFRARHRQKYYFIYIDRLLYNP